MAEPIAETTPDAESSDIVLELKTEWPCVDEFRSRFQPYYYVPGKHAGRVQLRSLEQEHIPKIIHQMWLDKVDANNTTAPAANSKHVASLARHNADFEFEFWNMTRVRALLTHPDLQPFEALFDAVPWITKCDIARLLVFAHPDTRGGLYIDLDFYGHRNLGPLCAGRQLLMFWEPKGHLAASDCVPGRILNGVMGTTPTQHCMWLRMLQFIKSNWEPGMTVYEAAGPLAVSKFVCASGLYAEKQHFLHHGLVIPFAWTKIPMSAYTTECNAESGRNCFIYTLWGEGSGWQQAAPATKGNMQPGRRLAPLKQTDLQFTSKRKVGMFESQI